MINFEVELELTWAKDYVLIENNKGITDIGFKITNTNLYVPVVTLSINDKIKFLETLKQEFKLTISWNKHRSEITTQPIIWFVKHLGLLIAWLFFHLKMVTIILKEILLVTTTCHSLNRQAISNRQQTTFRSTHEKQTRSV